ncbi:MAG: type III secretion system chaperone [Alphaproteobacteria bacterium GM202ARS2]|nr:type III secretion system chaperone [Alphaproteobacteria bacterium GM202ARS2]
MAERKNRPIDVLLAELGKSIGLDELYFDDNDGCLLQFDDTITLLLLYESRQDFLYLFSFVQELPAENKEKVLRRLMEANYRWTETEGATLSLNPGEDNVVMTLQLSAVGLDLSVLEDTIGRFVDSVERWSKYLVNPVADVKLPKAAGNGSKDNGNDKGVAGGGNVPLIRA